MADEKKASAPAHASYRVTHGTVVKGTHALGERTVANVGETVSLPPHEAKLMLDVGVIEAV